MKESSLKVLYELTNLLSDNKHEECSNLFGKHINEIDPREIPEFIVMFFLESQNLTGASESTIASIVAEHQSAIQIALAQNNVTLVDLINKVSSTLFDHHEPYMLANFLAIFYRANTHNGMAVLEWLGIKLASISTNDGLLLLKEMAAALSIELLMDLLSNLLKNSIDQLHSPVCLLYLKPNDLMDNSRLEKLFSGLSSEQLKIFEVLTNDNLEIHNALARYRDQYSELGKMRKYGILLQVAAINSTSNKPGTVISKVDFDDYFRLLHQAQPPFSEKFIVTGVHTISGVVEIDENGMTNILYNDPAPSEISRNSDFLSAVKLNFKSATIYVSDLQLQNSNAGCSAFSLEAFRIYEDINQYLPSVEDKKTLFKFLAHPDNVKKIEVLEDDITIITTRLPDKLLRVMQNRSIKTLLASSAEKAIQTPVNKKGRTALESTLPFFVFNPEKNKEYNTRLIQKFRNRSIKTLKFLIKNDDTDIDQLIKPYTVEGCKERLSNQQSQTFKK